MDRIDMHRLVELVRLHRLGCGAREVARLLKMGPNTERKYRKALDGAGLLAGEAESLPPMDQLKQAVLQALPVKTPKQHVSSLERWRQAIEGMVDKGSSPTAIYDRLRLEEKDFAGSLSAVKRLCLQLRKAQGVQPEDVAIPVETAAGEVAQVDFGYVGKLLDPDRKVLRNAWVFVMVLGYSRHMVGRIVFDQKVETWQRLHIEAFEELGGVPQVVVPDNLKAAVVRAAFGVNEVTTLNRSYRELARHYGFKVDPAPPRSPEKKGKVESGVKYAKRSFFKPRDELDAEILQLQLNEWVRQIAGQRLHGTTQKKPLEVFEAQERQELLPLPEQRFEPVTWREAKVHPDTHIMLEKAMYSVPWPLIGKQVLVCAKGGSVYIYADDERVATHKRGRPGQRMTIEAHLPPHRRELRHRNRSYWEQRADGIDPAVGHYIREVFDSDDVLYQLRVAQNIVTYLEQFPPARAPEFRPAPAITSDIGSVGGVPPGRPAG